jgi:hypothetical protein
MLKPKAHHTLRRFLHHIHIVHIPVAVYISAANVMVLLLLAPWSATVAQASEPGPTPTPDRLAKPALPANPSQADLGAVDYWFSCMVCHGDRGQGLTEEWRAASGPEDMNCWQSRCHASNHPPEGFELPTYAPLVIGEGALGRFDTALDLYAYIAGEMPWQMPGELDDEIYWRLTAFLLRENGLGGSDVELGPDNADQIRLYGPAPKANLQILADQIEEPYPTPLPTDDPYLYPLDGGGLPLWIIMCAFGGILLLASISWPLFMARVRRDRTDDEPKYRY